ncbi:DEAD/DEAH box helicase [soil metagenome]
MVVLKERLLYLLQPPLENMFGSRQVRVPFKPYPYQLEGIAFLMPRNAALLADEMGLGKTMQTILALRLLFHSGIIRRALLICPKPLVNNWSRELHAWAEDIPFEVIGGDYESRRRSWLVSNCPLKVVNYEILTRDAEFLSDEAAEFDVVVLDEAQRIKNRESKTAQVVRSVKRKRSWALTGTPIENRYEDLVNVFAFVDEDCIPPESTPKRVAEITSEYILRRVKEDVLTDMPPKTIRDAILELTPGQRESYELAEKEGVYRLNNLGDTITLQHVFELVMRLKQICNFDPVTGQSAKLEQLQADLMEVAESGRKAIVFSQWVEPLRVISQALTAIGPLEYHGRIPHNQRQGILDRFKADDSKHVLLMSYGTGSVGLNLQFTNYVFLFDRWWNPAVEDQAINRAHRLGQKSPVTVTRFIAQGTIEGRIAEVLEHKRQIFTEMLGNNGVPASMGLSQEEIFNLFDIGARPKRQVA